MSQKVLQLLAFFSISVLLISCSTSGNDVEEIEKESPDTTKSVATEIRKEMEHPKSEIKEEIPPNEKTLPKIFEIQIGAFSNEKNAEEYMAQAKIKIQYDFYYKLANGLYKVRFGNFSSVAEAASVLSKIIDAGYGDAFLIMK